MASEAPEQRTESYEMQDIPLSPQISHSASPTASVRSTAGGPVSTTGATQPKQRESGGLSTFVGGITGRIQARIRARTMPICNALINVCAGRVDVGLKVAAILSFVITAVLVWPSISSASDGHKAAMIAEWTARKDFLENCEAVSIPAHVYSFRPY
ncbi:hypothetical protein PG991_003441 [Apiospora marii]|uniref:Uncharacterized protein n=1 Tax=Apiospora marii TaxID=335849 RepID=A0ABR1S4R3_9PEZI